MAKKSAKPEDTKLAPRTPVQPLHSARGNGAPSRPEGDAKLPPTHSAEKQEPPPAPLSDTQRRVLTEVKFAHAGRQYHLQEGAVIDLEEFGGLGIEQSWAGIGIKLGKV